MFTNWIGYTGLVFLIIKKKGGKTHLVSTFSDDFHFSPYILFLLLLISILEDPSRFGPCCYIRNKKIDMTNGRNK